MFSFSRISTRRGDCDAKTMRQDAKRGNTSNNISVLKRQFGSLQSETLAPNNTGEFIPQHGKFGSSEELRRESTTFA